MNNIKTNQYIELYNPPKNNYFPVRVLERIKDGYSVHSLPNEKDINIYDFQLENYGFRNIWVSQKLLERLGFEKNGLIYTLDNIVIWECIIGELKNIDHPYYFYEYKSKHLGYAVLDESQVDKFQNDFNKIEYKSNNDKIKTAYFFANSMNDIFNYLLEQKSEKFSIKEFDKILIDAYFQTI